MTQIVIEILQVLGGERGWGGRSAIKLTFSMLLMRFTKMFKYGISPEILSVSIKIWLTHCEPDINSHFWLSKL